MSSAVQIVLILSITLVVVLALAFASVVILKKGDKNGRD